VSSEIKKTASMGMGHSGPWNIAAHLRGTESLVMDTNFPEVVELLRAHESE
jgi:hypothetical protein